MNFTELVVQFYHFILETAKAEGKKNQAEYYERRMALDEQLAEKDKTFYEFLGANFPVNAKLIKDLPLYKERIQAAKNKAKQEWDQASENKRQRMTPKAMNVDQASAAELFAMSMIPSPYPEDSQL